MEESFHLALAAHDRRTIAGQEVRRYHVRLEVPNARVQVVKQGIDLELRISDQKGGELIRIADWRDREGWLSALLERDSATEFVLEIRAVSETAPPGEYAIELIELPQAGPAANVRIEAERTMSRADHARYSHYLGAGGSREQALELFESARGLWRRIDLPREEARASFSSALIQQELGQMSDAHRTYEEAVDLWRGVGDERGLAATLNQMALVDQNLGQQSEALDIWVRPG
jgi:tetratricopeptide (TPR) repeat protein